MQKIEKDRFLSRLHRVVKDKAHSDIQKTAPTDILIRLKPSEVSNARFSKIFKYENEIIACCAILYVAITLAMWDLTNHWLVSYFYAFMLVLCLMALVTTATSLGYLFQPNRIAMNRRGLSYFKELAQIKMVINRISWSDIVQIRLTKGLLAGSKSKYLEIYTVKNIQARPVVKLPLKAFGRNNLKKLLKGLKQYLPGNKISMELHEEIERVEAEERGGPFIPTYTSIWLDSLSAINAVPSDKPLEPGTNLCADKYVIKGYIGSGGQGLVYSAIVTPSGGKPKNVVIKEFLLPIHAGKAAVRKYLDDIQQEAELLARLDHCRIVKVFDTFIEGTRSYLVLEHLVGVSLRQWIQQKGPCQESEAVSFGIQMCEILGYLHGLSPSVVHRDFTPENIMLCHEQQLHLLDFNVALQAQVNTGKTVVGKRAYIPPEQFRGQACPQSDIYALGATLCYLVIGEDPEPLSASSPKAVKPEISDQFDAIVRQATAIALESRFESVQVVESELKKLANK